MLNNFAKDLPMIYVMYMDCYYIKQISMNADQFSAPPATLQVVPVNIFRPQHTRFY